MTSHTVPKTLKNVGTEYQGLPLKYIFTLILASAIALILISAAVTSRNNVMLLGVVATLLHPGATW